MSKKQKLLAKLFRLPAPADFTWDELVTLMSHHDFEAHPPSGGGSHYTFQHRDGFTFTMSRTHPSGILKSYQVKNAKEALRAVGAK